MIRRLQALITIAAVMTASGVASGVGCSGSPGGPTINNKLNSNELAPAVSSVVSTDILAREPIANTATVKHILISWHDLADAFGEVVPADQDVLDRCGVGDRLAGEDVGRHHRRHRRRQLVAVQLVVDRRAARAAGAAHAGSDAGSDHDRGDRYQRLETANHPRTLPPP